MQSIMNNIRVRLYLCVALYTFCSLQSAYGLADKYRCMWRDDPATSMVIGWNQASGTNPILYYSTTDFGTDIQSYDFSQMSDRVVVARGMNNHFARLQNLIPATTYYFIIADSEGINKRLSFRTLPDNNCERLSIIAGGDSRNYRNARRNANKLVGKLKPHVVLFGGDMTGGDNATQWRGWFDDWQHTITSEGRLTPIVVTRGNHEYSNKTLVDLFDVEESGLYYALNFGGDLMRVYTLNSLISRGGNQKAWLEDDLAAHTHVRWKSAQYHFAIRPHTRKKREQNDQLKLWGNLFHEYGVNLVVESDAHCVKTTYPVRPSRGAGSDEGFVRDDQTGTVYVGEGCWGAPLRRNDDDKKWTRNSGSFNQFKWIFVDYNSIEVRTVKTDNADQVGEVSPQDIFSPPTNVDIWNPSNGPVIYIYPQNRPRPDQEVLLASTSSIPVFSPRRDMAVLSFNAIAGKSGVIIRWESHNEPRQQLTYQVQRSTDGAKYKTIAKVEGQGQQVNNYQILDTQNTNPNDQEKWTYRLVHNNSASSQDYPQSKVAPSPALQVAQQWKAYDALTPDPSTGMLRIKYSLSGNSDVRIQLKDVTDQSISRSDYKDQKPGNFLKSIDMKDFPKGTYLLIIEVGKDVLHRYRVEHA